MEDYRRLLLNNKAWVQDKLNISPTFLKTAPQSRSQITYGLAAATAAYLQKM